MKKLLLPVDGSPSSRRAAELAVRMLSGKPGAQVLLANAQSPVMAWEISPHVTAEMVNRIHEKAGREAVRAPRGVPPGPGFPREDPLLVGAAAEIIARVAEEQRVDGIVMGTRGLGPVKGLVLGSVANKVIHLAEVPVTLVK